VSVNEKYLNRNAGDLQEARASNGERFSFSMPPLD